MKSQRYALPVACTGPADDLWRIDIKHTNGDAGHINDVPRKLAEMVLGSWSSGSPGGVSFCSRCPEGHVPAGPCSHPNGVVFLFSEFAEVRIMPMREAV